MKFRYPHPRITERDLQDYEDKHQIKLPADYRQFLLDCNGGRGPDIDTFIWDPNREDVHHPSNYESIDVFLGIKGTPNYATVDFFFRREDQAPHDFFPFAFGGHARLLISLRAEDYWQIYIWDSNWDFALGTDDDTVLWRANNFTEFMGSLMSYEEGKKLWG